MSGAKESGVVARAGYPRSITKLRLLLASSSIAFGE